MRVSVSSTALDIFIEYADNCRMIVDSEFACSNAEIEESQREFDDLVASLDRREELWRNAGAPRAI